MHELQGVGDDSASVLKRVDDYFKQSENEQYEKLDDSLIDIQMSDQDNFEQAMEVRSAFADATGSMMSLIEEHRSSLTDLEDVVILDREIDAVVRFSRLVEDTAESAVEIAKVLIEMQEAQKGWQ